MVAATQIAVESQVSGSIACARNNVLFYLVVTAKTIAPLRRGFLSPKPKILKNFGVASYYERSPPRFRGVGYPPGAGSRVLFQGTAFRMPRSRDLSVNNPSEINWLQQGRHV